MSDSKQVEIPEDKPAVEPDVPNANERVEISADDLPLHCPMPGKRLWDSHPKVFLPIEDSGQELCPYCGTLYVLTGPVKSGH